MKAVKQKWTLILAGGTMLFIVATLLLWMFRGPEGRHWSKPLPATSELIHYHVRTSGFDRSYLFEFEVQDDALVKRLVSEWKLIRTSPTTFAKTKIPEWWNLTQIAASTEKYGRTDDESERYWSVWVTQDSRRVFVEYGKW